MSLDAFACIVKHGTYLYLWFGYTESPFYVPKVVVCCVYILYWYIRIGEISSSSLYATPIVASSFILPPIFSTTITQILPDGYFFLRTNIVKIPFVSPNIRWPKDSKYCLSTSYKIRIFWVTKSGDCIDKIKKMCVKTRKLWHTLFYYFFFYYFSLFCSRIFLICCS